MSDRDQLCLSSRCHSVVEQMLHSMTETLRDIQTTEFRLECTRRTMLRHSRTSAAMLWLARMLGGNSTAQMPATVRTISTALAEILSPEEMKGICLDADASVLAPPYVLEVVLEDLITTMKRQAPASRIMIRAYLEEQPQQGWPKGCQIKHSGCLIWLTVAGNGPGISLDRRSLLFEPDDLFSSKSGSGLWFCRMLLRAHGGDIWFDDTLRGTSVTSVWQPDTVRNSNDGWPQSTSAFGQAVYKARVQAGWTRLALSLRAEISQSTVRNIEMRHLNTTAKTRRAVICALESLSASRQGK